MRQHGPEIADDERKLDALLTQACGPKFNNEILMLVTAAMARVPTELRASEADAISDSDLNRYALRIQNEFGVTESLARWAVGTWAFALGIPPAHPKSFNPPAATNGEATTAATSATVQEFPISREGLLAAIRSAQADGVVTAEERESLRQLAAKVKTQLGDAALLPPASPAWYRRYWVIGTCVGLAVVLLAGWLLFREEPQDQPVSNAATRGVSETPDDLGRAQMITPLREKFITARERLTTLQQAHASARIEVQQFGDRLRRAAQQAQDQNRSTFGMAGQTYTRERLGYTLEYTDQYVAERQADETAIAAELERIESSLRQLESATNIAEIGRVAPSTLPARGVPPFDLSNLQQSH